MDGLRQSKKQSEDIKKALESAKVSDAYLFGENEPINNSVGLTNGARGKGKGSDMPAIRAAMRLPTEQK